MANESHRVCSSFIVICGITLNPAEVYHLFANEQTDDASMTLTKDAISQTGIETNHRHKSGKSYSFANRQTDDAVDIHCVQEQSD